MDFFSENFNIFLKNMSVVYVFSMTALVSAAIAIIYFVITNNMQARQSAKKKLEKNSDSEGETSEHESDDDDEFNSKKNLIGRLKTAKLKLLEESMTEEQKQAEKEIERQQLAAIFKLLKEQEQQRAEPISIDESELQAQLNLYR